MSVPATRTATRDTRPGNRVTPVTRSASADTDAVETVIRILGGTVIDPNRCAYPKCRDRGHEYGDHGVWCIRHRKVMVPGSFLSSLREQGKLPGSDPR